MEKIVLIALLLIYFLLITKQPVYCRDHRKHGHLSPYLEPPPRSLRTIPTIHKRPATHKSGHHVGSQQKDHFSMNSIMPNFSKWFWPSGKPDKEKAASDVSSKSVLQTRSHDYAVEEAKCNPCNSVPWIPIVGSHRPKQLDLGFHQQPQDFAGNSYYSSFNDMSSNLKPINVAPSAFPLYFGTSVYTPELTHNHLPAQDLSQNLYHTQDFGQNHLQPQDFAQNQFQPQDFGHNQFQTQNIPQNHLQFHDFGQQPLKPEQNPIPIVDLTHHVAENPSAGFHTSWNAAPSYTASGSDNVHEPSLYNPQLGPHPGHIGHNNSADSWLYEPKVMPLSQYLLSVDHPMQIYQTPLLDVSTFHVPNPGANLPLHVQNQVFEPTQAPAPVHEEPTNHFTSPTGDANHDQFRPLTHNSLDDAKYSSSESKFSSVGAESIHTNDTNVSNDFLENITSSLIEYLTPPNLSPNEEWELEPETETPKKKKQIQIVIPYTVDKSGLKGNSSSLWTTEKSLSQRLRELWSPYAESTTALPIVSYLKANSNVSFGKSPGSGNPPKRQEWSDMLRLQKAIDTWTVEGYSNHKQKQNDYYFQKVVTSTLPPSKEIPSDFLASTVSYLHVEPVHNFRGVRNQIPVIEEKMHLEPLHHNSSSKVWEKLPVSVSPLTKEKVYIVTPLPLKSYNFSAEGVVENWP